MTTVRVPTPALKEWRQQLKANMDIDFGQSMSVVIALRMASNMLKSCPDLKESPLGSMLIGQLRAANQDLPGQQTMDFTKGSNNEQE